jgi:hypothetical protein
VLEVNTISLGVSIVAEPVEIVKSPEVGEEVGEGVADGSGVDEGVGVVVGSVTTGLGVEVSKVEGEYLSKL